LAAGPAPAPPASGQHRAGYDGDDHAPRPDRVLLGLSPFDIRLPDEDAAVAPLEGALQVRADGGRFVLETVDYGRAYRLLEAGSEDETKEAVIGYVSRPLPPVRAMARPELDTLLGRVAGHYGKLLNDLRTEQGFVIDLPPQLPLDRIGALDGVHIYPIGTPSSTDPSRRMRCAPRTTCTSS
jgi:hypothetical protein